MGLTQELTCGQVPKKKYFTKADHAAGNARRQSEWRERQKKLTEERLRQKAAAFAEKVKAWEKEEERNQKGIEVEIE